MITPERKTLLASKVDLKAVGIEGLEEFYKSEVFFGQPETFDPTTFVNSDLYETWLALGCFVEDERESHLPQFAPMFDQLTQYLQENQIIVADAVQRQASLIAWAIGGEIVDSELLRPAS